MFEKASCLVKIMKSDQVKALSQEKLARYIAIYIGSSKIRGTVGMYTDFMLGIGMLKREGTKFKVNYGPIKP